MNTLQNRIERDIQEEICILIPMRKYSLYNEFQQQFWSQSFFNLVIVDNMKVWVKRPGDSITTYPFKDEENSLEKRILKAQHYAPGKFVMWLGEDDLIDFLGFYSAIKKLKALNSNDSQQGRLFSIYSSPRSFDLRFLTGKKKHAEYSQRFSTLDDSPKRRVDMFLENPIDRHFYALMPKNEFFQAFRIIASEGTVSNLLWERLFPSYFELMCTILLKTRHDDCEWYLKGQGTIRLDGLKSQTVHVPNYLATSISREKREFDIWTKKIATTLEQAVPEIRGSAQYILERLIVKLIKEEQKANTQYIVEKKSKLRQIQSRLINSLKTHTTKFAFLSRLISNFKKILSFLHAVSVCSTPWSMLRFSKRFRHTAQLIVTFRSKRYEQK